MNIYQVNTFTNKVFLGNSIGVCLLNEPVEKDYMENVALELNLSETIFLCKDTDGYKTNIFSPKGELCLCIKSILAASHILWQEGLIDEKEHIKFYCREDVLETKLNTDFIEIKIPLTLEKKLCLLHNFSKALEIEEDLTIDYLESLKEQKTYIKGNSKFKIRLEGENIILSGSAITVIVGDLII
ncbi:PhzF family phenazine biosynthesis protein [Clostridium botulinum]|uniref:Conserved domain protein n=1 Tax=Clostridium botulinum (strain Okra / Type B1) TaxID=498213 RepID=B1IM07_CLOBK|nr:PhzF family phenazine biosynthesis protein [Clostridium botulinum]EKX78957.1 hypothetical protein CFSAN001628_015508 [Clostridium botulinum CFSAN001628]ACA45236.1 conserved domain protein [Clostridium botulinum B1 str. Okra]MBD5562340.1 PhzF family phenazine biosynthesis protein [Clostridium botulinum]MBD5567725.1 PhzF family phenazine biosynthesis protein [Clostridium botulinum]MBD5571774.1 PhzF family phenazine biosynthesis protein [Clostridium botulinum]